MLVVMDMESMAGWLVVSKMFISGSDDALWPKFQDGCLKQHSDIVGAFKPDLLQYQLK